MQGLLWVREEPSYTNNVLKPWEEGDLYIGLKYSPILEASLGWEFTNELEFLDQQHNFLNGSVKWNITPSTSLNLFIGGQRGGLRCISGDCETFPPFQGARLTFVVRG
jgi:hypothetical protein